MTHRSIPFRDDDTARSYQLALIALCVLALIAAALTLPPVSGFPTAGSGQGGIDDGSGGGGGGGGDGGIELQPSNETSDPGNVTSVNGTLDRECAVYLLGQPTPGSTIPVVVLREDASNAGIPVRFNGEVVGETDDRGVVVGEVPYTQELEVSVDVPGDVECVFVGPDGERRQSLVSAGFVGTGLTAGQVATDSRANYTVDGEVRIGIRGEPYPGEEVQVLAAIEGVPMDGATVSIDGEPVTRTGSDGRATITVPDERRDTITVGVSRGDFAGSRDVDVLLLRVAVRPDAPLAIPGGDATAHATIGGDPVPDARVTLGGEVLGTTDERGRVQFSLPADPTTTVAVAGQEQRATTSLWPVYVPTIGLLAIYLGVLAVAYWRDGVRGTVGVLAATSTLAGLVVLLYGLVRGRDSIAIVGGALLVLGLGTLFWQRAHWRSATREGAGALSDFVAGLVVTTARLVYEAAVALERFVLWVGARVSAIVERVRTMPRSVRGLLAVVWAWVRGIPGRLVALVRGVLRAPGRLLAWWRDSDGAADSASDPVRTASNTGDERTHADQFSLRAAWRRFARWVVPGPWRRRTPGEVARAAVSDGFPGTSVGEFTDVFRDVEYGERPLTEERRERAEEAFESLRRHRDEEASD